MSDVAAKMREAGKVQADPALAAIQELNDSVAGSFDVLDKENKKTAEKAERLFTDVKGDLEKARTEMAAGFKVHSEKLNTLDRRSVAIGGGGFRDVSGNCLAAIDAEDRKVIPQIALTIKPDRITRREQFPILSTPEGASLTALLLHASLKLQRRMFRSQQEEAALWQKIERYNKALSDSFGMDTAAMLVTGTTDLGGHWLPDPVANELYRLITDNSVISPLATHVPMTTKTLDLPTEGSSSLSISWGTEGATNITDSAPASNAINKVTLTAARLNGWAESSIEEIQDSPISIMAWILQKLTEQAGREIDAQCLGEGATTTFTGLRTLSGVGEMSGSGANGVVFPTFQGFVNQVFKGRERATRAGAAWFIAPEAMGLIAGMRSDSVTAADGAGLPLFQYSAGLPGDISGNMLGFPVVVHSVISAARTYGTGTGHSTVYFGPPSHFVIGDRMGMSWDVSDLPNFRQATVQMRLITRLAIAVDVAGAFARASNIKTA
jgi:HK97 family phage major capsid protein